MDHPMPRGIYSQVIFRIPAARTPSPQFEHAEKEAWQHMELANTALCDGLDIRLIGIVCRMDVALARMIIALDAM